MAKTHDVTELVRGLPSLAPGALNRTLQGPMAGIVFVGASGAGKTTLIKKLTDLSQGSSWQFSVPQRYTTRSPRANEVLGENIHVSEQEFELLVAGGELGLWWQKEIVAGVYARFGFSASALHSRCLLSGNNGLLYSCNVQDSVLSLQRMLLLGVVAPEETRRRRLLERNPDLYREKRDEFDARLSENRDLRYDVDVVVQNFGAFEARAPMDLWGIAQRIFSF